MYENFQACITRDFITINKKRDSFILASENKYANIGNATIPESFILKCIKWTATQIRLSGLSNLNVNVLKTEHLRSHH